MGIFVSKLLLVAVFVVSLSLLVFADHCSLATSKAACESRSSYDRCTFSGLESHGCGWAMTGFYPYETGYCASYSSRVECTSTHKECGWDSRSNRPTLCTNTGTCEVVGGRAECKMDCVTCPPGNICEHASDDQGLARCQSPSNPPCDANSPDQCIMVSADPLQYDLLLSQTCTVVHCDPGWGCESVSTASGGTTVRCVEPTLSETPTSDAGFVPLPQGSALASASSFAALILLLVAGYSVSRN